MENFSDLIRNRRSMRKFTDEELAQDQVLTLLKAALMAPSSKRSNCWQFIVVDDKDTLEKLKGKGKQLGIITSKTHAEFDGDTVIQSIKDMFEVIICASDSPRPKPFGDPIITYMEKTGTTEKDVIYIGDSTYDFECAQNANVYFGWAAWGDSQIAGIDSKYKFSKPEEILTLC